MAKIEIKDEIFNKVYRKHIDNETRYEIYYGGSGSGKSHFIAQRMIYRHMKESGHNTLIVRKVAATNRISTFPLLKQVISEWGVGKLFKINEADMRIRCNHTRNEIAFVGLDDVEKIKSVTFENGILTSIWIEEASEIEQDDFTQLNLRLRGQSKVPKQITLSFNPIVASHWLKSYFFDREVDDSIIVKTTYKDNAFLDNAYKMTLESMKETDYYHYMVYALGEWGLLGRSVFDSKALSERMAEIKTRPYIQGSFVFDYDNERIVDESIKFINDPKGYLRVFVEPDENTPYVIGGDTSEGGHDWSIGQVLDNTTGEQVAVWKGQLDTDLYAKQMYCLGKYYNNALIAIESNFDLHPIKELQRLGYRKQYQRETIDKISRKVHAKYGFQTNRVTRPVIIDNLKIIVRESCYLLNDYQTLDEMMTFVINDSGKPEAMDGKHDDLIMALAIAYKAREQQSYQKIADIEKITGTWSIPELRWKGFSTFEIKKMEKSGQIKLVGG